MDEYIAETDKSSDYHARLGELWKAYIDLLKQIEGAETAERIAPQLAGAADAIVEHAHAHAGSGKSFWEARQSTRQVSISPADAARMNEAERNYQKATGAYLSQKFQAKREDKRISTLTGLSRSFWNAYLMADLRANAAIYSSSEAKKTNSRPTLANYLALAERDGIDKTAKLTLRGAADKDAEAAKAELSKALGPQVDVVAIRMDVEEGYLLVASPVGRIADSAAAISFGKVIAQSEDRRSLDVEVPKTAPVVPVAAKKVAKPETPSAAKAQAASNEAPAAEVGGLQGEYRRLASALNAGDYWAKKEAATTLLVVRPQDVDDPEVRKLIARGYRNQATEAGGPSAEAVRGLAIWGGKYSIPILIELLEKSRTRAPEELFAALASFRDPRAAEAIAKQLGNYWNHEAAASALRKMGSVAEPILIAAAPSGNAKVSLTAVQLLGDVGGEKSMALLEKATKSRNAEVKAAAREATKKIRLRQKEGKNVDDALADANSPFAPTTGPPVDIIALKAKNEAREKAKAAAGGQDIPESQLADWSKVKTLPEEKPSGTTVPADPAPVGDAGWVPHSVRLSKPADASDHPVAFDIGSGGPVPLVAVVHAASTEAAFARLEMVSLADGKSLATTQIVGGNGLRCFLSQNGSRVLVISNDQTHYKQARLNVWEYKDGKLIERGLWYPYAAKPYWTNTIKWAGWVDDEHFCTLNKDGALVLWQVDGRKAVYQSNNRGSDVAAALSPGGKYVALTNWSGLNVLEAATGAGVAHLADAVSDVTAIAFSASGEKLATSPEKTGYLLAYDLTSGKSLGHAYGGGGSTIAWLDEQFILAGSDVQVPGILRPVWRYQFPGPPFCQRGAWHWVWNGDGLVPIKLPDTEAIAAAKSPDANDVYFELKPGMKVSLEVQLSQENAEIRAIIEKAIAKLGLQIVDGQPVKFSAGDRTGETKEQTYRFYGRMPDQKVSYTERSIYLHMEVNGKNLWSKGTMLRAPGHIQLKEGESAQQKVDEVYREPWVKIFEGLEIPQKVIDHSKAAPIGISKVSANGV